MSFKYRSPASRSSCTPSDTASSSTYTTSSTNVSSCNTSNSFRPDLCLEENDYEFENELAIAACAIQHDGYDCEEESRIMMNVVDVRMHWEDNAVNMQVNQASLTKITEAQKRRRRMEREEAREARRKERKLAKAMKEEKEDPTYLDFMAEVRSKSRIEKMPSWTYDAMAEWSKESAESGFVGENNLEAEIFPASPGPARLPPTMEGIASAAVSVQAVVGKGSSGVVELGSVTVIEEITNVLPLICRGSPVCVGPGEEIVKEESLVDLTMEPQPLGLDRESRCAIRSIPGKGLGVLATTDIAQGDAIITECPFLTVDHPPLTQQVISRLSRLPLDQQDLFHTFNPTLAPIHPNRLIDIVATNVIPLGGDIIEELDEDVVILNADGEPEERCKSGLFKTICRVNHSCAPNSRWTWVESSGMMILKALRPIANQEEITACYLQETTLGYNDRQQQLFDTWRFICDCPVCSLSFTDRLADDDRRSEFRELRDMYIEAEDPDTWQSEGLVTCSKNIKKAIKLLIAGNQYEEIANCRWSLFMLSARWGDEEKAKREGSAWLREVNKMGDDPGEDNVAQIKRPRISVNWGIYDDDRSGDESECDTEDDFETSHDGFMEIRLERAHTEVSSSRQSRRNSTRAATVAGR